MLDSPADLDVTDLRDVSGRGGAVDLDSTGDRSPSAAAYGLAAFLAAALLPTAFSASLFSPTFTPKFAVLLVVGAVGAVPLVRLARRSQVSWAARGALAFLVVALVSALFSPAVNIGFFGLYDWGTGWLFWFGCAGAFALGARLSADQLKWAMGGIVLAAAGNAVAAVIQIVTQPNGAFALYQGSQADGLLGNPIHLEGVLLGALALIAGKASVEKERMLWWPVVLLLGVALEFTLERVALPIMVVIVAGALVAYGLRRAAPFAVLTLAGYTIGYLSGGSGLGSRVTTATTATTYGTRFEIWSLALRGLAHRPLLGVGPGEAISAIVPHVSSRFAAHLGPVQLPVDSHDFLIEVAATTGVLGLIAFVAWLGGAALRARGPFLACAIAMLAVELIEPLNVGVTPVALLALGAATVTVTGQPVGLAAIRRWLRRGSEQVESVPGRATAPATTEVAIAGGTGQRVLRPAALATSVLVVAALFVGVTMLAGDRFLLDSYEQIQPPDKIASATDANRLLPYWPDSAVAISTGYLFAANDNGGRPPLEHALAWSLTAASRDPADPILRAAVGNLELQLGNHGGAQLQDLQALRLDPWTYLALEGLGTIAREDGDWTTSLYWYKRAFIVAPAANDLAHLISEDEAHLHAVP